jgi:transcriptional regulator with XRE-family HTH domain
MKDIKKAFGLRVKELRKKLGISQEEAADRAGLHFTYWGAVERGEKNLTIESMQKIATGLGTTVGPLFKYEKGYREEDLAAVAEIYGLIKGLSNKQVEIAKRILKATVAELKKG